MTKPKFFFIRQEMLRVCAFYNKFSILGPFDLSEWVLDGQALPGTRSGPAHWRMDFFPIFFLRRLSCGVSQLLEGAGWVQLTFGAKRTSIMFIPQAKVVPLEVVSGSQCEMS